MADSAARAEMPQGINPVLDRRTVVNSNANLLALVKRSDAVLDAGCGSGAITRDIAALVGPQGSVVGIDTSEHLIAQARERNGDIPHLSFVVADVNQYTTHMRFDVVSSARVLQWLAQPLVTVQKLADFVKPGGCLTILDYNHSKAEFSPAIPASMEKFYQAFLRWRADAGMDNAIADHLDEMFRAAGLSNIQSSDFSEVSIHGQANFQEEITLWLKVAELRGPQVVADNYISENERQQAMKDYAQWMQKDAQFMKLYLRACTGYQK